MPARAGKFWGVEHDLCVVLGRGLAAEGAPPFTARFDYLYYTAAALRLVGYQPALPPEGMRQRATHCAQRSDPGARHPVLRAPPPRNAQTPRSRPVLSVPPTQIALRATVRV